MSNEKQTAPPSDKGSAAKRNDSQQKNTTKLPAGGNGNGANPEAARAALEALRHAVPADVGSEVIKAFEAVVTKRLGGDPSLESLLPPIRKIGAVELLSKEINPVVWAIPQLLPAGLAILAGRPKVGKSWLALQICQSVVTGGRVFDKPVEKGRILYLALEDNEGRLQRRMLAQRWPRDAGGADFILPEAFREQIQYLNSGGGNRLAKLIRDECYRMVVVDTFSRALKGDQKDEQDMTAAMAPLQETALALQIAVVLIDHHKKPMFASDPNPVDDILGSTAKGAVPDAILGLYKEPGKHGAKLAIVNREADELTLKLEFDRETCCWQCEGEAFEIEITERRKEILDTLRMFEAPAQLARIAKSVGQPESNTFVRLQDMVNAGTVLRITEGNHVFYDLPGKPRPVKLEL